MPRTATAQLIFPSSNGIDYPGSDLAYSYLDTLATVSELISGGTPSLCYHGLPSDITNTPLILPLEPITHSTVSVLTQVGRPVTLSVPPVDGDDGSQPTTSDDGSSPQSEILGSDTQSPMPQTGNGGAPVTKLVVGGNTIEQEPSAVIVNGQTITPGEVSTIGNDVIVSVGSGTTVLVVAGSTLTLSPIPTGTSVQSTTKPSNPAPQSAIASAIGIPGFSETGICRSWIMALEFIVVFGLPGLLALL